MQSKVVTKRLAETNKQQLSRVSKGELAEQVKYRLDCKVTKDKDGNVISSVPYKTIDNYEIILDHDCRFAGKIKFDEFSRSTCLKGSVPWEMKENYRPWNDYDDSALYLRSRKGANNEDIYTKQKIFNRNAQKYMDDKLRESCRGFL